MITFTVDESTYLDFKEPLANGYGQAKPPRQTRTMSGGGVVRVTQTGDPDNTINMEFRDVEADDYLALVSFIEDDLQHSGVTFTFTDPWGNDHTGMMYWAGIETWKPGKGGRYRGQLVIRKNLGA